MWNDEALIVFESLFDDVFQSAVLAEIALLQIITAALLLMQVFSFIIILYLCGGFPFHLATFTSTIGFVMLGIALFFAAWNIIALIQRKRQINKASNEAHDG